MWGGTPGRNMSSAMTGLPETWDVRTGTNIKWKTQLGSTSNGNPVVSGGKIFLGTNNGHPRNPAITGDKGVLMCFRESDGTFLWQAVTEKLESGGESDWPEEGVCSSPVVEGKRLYYVTNRGELVCLDTEGFMDGTNDGPFQGEGYKGPTDADVVWKLDMGSELASPSSSWRVHRRSSGTISSWWVLPTAAMPTTRRSRPRKPPASSP
jgi:outer membrane protein assembly factor BamB